MVKRKGEKITGEDLYGLVCLGVLAAVRHPKWALAVVKLKNDRSTLDEQAMAEDGADEFVRMFPAELPS